MEQGFDGHKILIKIKSLESTLSSNFSSYNFNECPINKYAIKSSTEEIIKEFKGYIPNKIKMVLDKYNDIDLMNNLELVDKFVYEIKESLD